MFSKKVYFNENEPVSHTNTQHMPLFDNECEDVRKIFYNELNNYRRDKTVENQSNMVRARANYKRLIRQKRFNFDKAKTSKLIVSKYNYAKEY